MRSLSFATLALPVASVGDQSICTKPDGSTAPCAPGNQECSKDGYGQDTPQFHVRDNSCSENDPNGPSYDPVHGVYHLHYQNHVGLHGGRTYGHAVSRDFVHWAHMPISIWNDRPYDDSAIYTGSATIVDGKVIQVYPGLCNTKNEGCPGGTNLCIAVAADESDELATNWTKEEYAINPIVNATGRDPSTAWKTPAGEWQLTTFDTQIFGSMDFKTWYRLGAQPNFAHGECPSFFPLPRTTPGAGPAPKGAETPTHVHKASHGGDWMNVGTYVAPTQPRTLGTWSATPGVPFEETKIDMGNYYASKDFYDPVKKRQINWGWAQVSPGSTQSLPREVTWHPELQQLVHSPVEEQDQLRTGVIGSLSKQTLSSTVSLGLPDSVGSQSEIAVSFAKPSVAARLSVNVMEGTSKPLEPPYAREMEGYDLAGQDFSVTNVNYTDYRTCEAACDADDRCKAWTYVIRKPLYASCCLKSGVPGYRKSGTCTSGVKSLTPTASGTEFYVDFVPSTEHISTVTVGGGGHQDSLKLLSSDKTVDMKVYVDKTFAEAYWMGGRVAMTVKTPSTKEAGISVTSNAAVTLNSATVWSVGSIWVTPEEVKATPRLDANQVV